MKKLLLIVSFFAFQFIWAQQTVTDAAEENIYKVEDVDPQPDFPAGIEAFYISFKKQFKAPEVPGLVDKVVLGFVIEKDGSITDIRIVHDAGFGTGEQCRQILETSFPKWLPGTKDGKKVRTLYLLPIAVITE
jgi:protein TonB